MILVSGIGVCGDVRAARGETLWIYRKCDWICAGNDFIGVVNVLCILRIVSAQRDERLLVGLRHRPRSVIYGRRISRPALRFELVCFLPLQLAGRASYVPREGTQPEVERFKGCDISGYLQCPDIG